MTVAVQILQGSSIKSLFNEAVSMNAKLHRENMLMLAVTQNTEKALKIEAQHIHVLPPTAPFKAHLMHLGLASYLIKRLVQQIYK